MSRLISSSIDSYKERQARNNLKIAVQSALGSSLNLEKYNELQSSSQTDKDIAESLSAILTVYNSSLRYPQLTPPPSPDITDDENENVAKYDFNDGKRKTRHGLYFFNQDADFVVHAEQELSKRERARAYTKAGLIEKQAKTKASKVYCSYNTEVEDFQYLGCAVRTLRVVNAMDNIYNLSKLPSSFDLNILMKNQDFTNSYSQNENDNMNDENDPTQISVSEPASLEPIELDDENTAKVTFNDKIFTKLYDKNALPYPKKSKKRAIHTTVDKKKILKNGENANFSKEIEMAQFCDLVDIAMFIRLLDTMMKKRLKKHERAKFNRNTELGC